MSGDLWLYDLARNNRTRFTHQSAVSVATTPVWSPDGKYIAYTANINGAHDLFSINVRTEQQQVLYTNSYPKFVSDWSRDGHYIIYTELHPNSQADIWCLPLESADSCNLEAGEPVPVVKTRFIESAGQISPDSCM